MAAAPFIIGAATSLGTSIAAATTKPKVPDQPEKRAAKYTAQQKQASARAQGLSSLILTRNRAPLGMPGNAPAAT